MTTVASQATSSAGIYATNRLEESWRKLKDSDSQGAPALIDDLLELWGECGASNWDGFGAEAVDRMALGDAIRFVRSLPLRFPSPSPGAEPDGSVTLEWYRSPSWLVSISFNGAGEIHYAALLGRRKSYGLEMLRHEPPETILTLVREVAPT